MLCEQAREHLSAYADKELTAELSAAVRAHLGACADCRTLLDDLRTTAALLGRLPARKAPDGLAADVLREIETRTLLDGGHPLDLPARERSLPVHHVRLWPRALAVAATLVLAAGIGLLAYLEQTRQGPPALLSLARMETADVAPEAAPTTALDWKAGRHGVVTNGAEPTPLAVVRGGLGAAAPQMEADLSEPDLVRLGADAYHLWTEDGLARDAKALGKRLRPDVGVESGTLAAGVPDTNGRVRAGTYAYTLVVPPPAAVVPYGPALPLTRHLAAKDGAATVGGDFLALNGGSTTVSRPLGELDVVATQAKGGPALEVPREGALAWDTRGDFHAKDAAAPARRFLGRGETRYAGVALDRLDAAEHQVVLVTHAREETNHRLREVFAGNGWVAIAPADARGLAAADLGQSVESCVETLDRAERQGNEAASQSGKQQEAARPADEEAAPRPDAGPPGVYFLAHSDGEDTWVVVTDGAAASFFDRQLAEDARLAPARDAGFRLAQADPRGALSRFASAAEPPPPTRTPADADGDGRRSRPTDASAGADTMGALADKARKTETAKLPDRPVTVEEVARTQVRPEPEAPHAASREEAGHRRLGQAEVTEPGDGPSDRGGGAGGRGSFGAAAAGQPLADRPSPAQPAPSEAADDLASAARMKAGAGPAKPAGPTAGLAAPPVAPAPPAAPAAPVASSPTVPAAMPPAARTAPAVPAPPAAPAAAVALSPTAQARPSAEQAPSPPAKAPGAAPAEAVQVTGRTAEPSPGEKAAMAQLVTPPASPAEPARPNAVQVQVGGAFRGVAGGSGAAAGAGARPAEPAKPAAEAESRAAEAAEVAGKTDEALKRDLLGNVVPAWEGRQRGREQVRQFDLGDARKHNFWSWYRGPDRAVLVIRVRPASAEAAERLAPTAAPSVPAAPQ